MTTLVHNTVICGAKVVLFLGAGASQPFGMPLMESFIQQLEKESFFATSHLFKAIISERRDLEFLMEELEEWTQREYFCREPVVGQGLRGLTVTASPAEQAYDSSFATRLRETVRNAKYLLSFTRGEVFRTYRAIEYPKKLDLVFAPIFDRVFAGIGEKGTLVIFTTNYDPGVEEFRRLNGDKFAIEDGFHYVPSEEALIWKREHFDGFTPDSARRNIVLFKLHGSAQWMRTPQGIVKSPVTAHAEGDPLNENVLIYPAMRKVAIEDPFFTAYDYLEKTLEHAQRCIVIGYSFRDQDALTKVKAAVIKNPDLKILVLDPKAGVIVKLLAEHGIPADPCPMVFGISGAELQYLPKIDSFFSWMVDAA